MREVVWVGVCGGKQFAWAAFGGRGARAWGSGGVCGGHVRVTGRAGRAMGRGASCGGCVRVAGCGEWRGVFGGWVPGGLVRLFWRVGDARVAGPGASLDGGRVWAARRVAGGEGQGQGLRGGGVVSVYVSACSGVLVWSVVGQAVRRRSLPSSAAAARILQMSVPIWCTCWSVVGRGYASSGPTPTRRMILWMAWYPQVRECCDLGEGSLRVSWPASNCVWAVGMAQIQGTVPVDGERRWIRWVRRSMASPRW